jgi:hypothetical protein
LLLTGLGLKVQIYCVQMAACRQDVSVSWTRYEGRARAQADLVGDALHAALEDEIRACNPQLTDVRLERATEAERDEIVSSATRQWYDVTYLADNGEGY